VISFLRSFGESVVVLMLVALIFAPLEDLRPVQADVKLLSRKRLTDFMHALATPIVAGLLLTGGAALFGATLRSFAMPGALHAFVARLPWYVVAPIAVVLIESSTYAMHYAMHRVPLLWRFHAIHHSAEQLDFLAGMRRHPVDIALSSTAAALPGFVLGFSPTTILAYAVFFRFWTIFVHANIKIRLGHTLERVVASPFFHHGHHAKDEREPRNLASTLALLDVLFGTYRERSDWPAEYGADEPVAKSWLGQILLRSRR